MGQEHPIIAGAEVRRFDPLEVTNRPANSIRPRRDEALALVFHAQFAQLVQLDAQAVPQRALGTQLVEQHLRLDKRLAVLLTLEQACPGPGDFLLGKHASYLSTGTRNRVDITA